jgi:Holliday junction resolvasome RuvABC endonuclease subunit
MEKHLGLDISTSCTGWAITCVEVGSPVSVELGHVRLDRHDGLMSKSDAMREELDQLHKKHSFTRIYVEENMQAFRPGASSAQTIMKLAKFNGIVSYLAYSVSGLDPISVNVNHARKSLGINLKREKECGISTKEQVHSWVRVHPLLLGYEWPCRLLGSGPRKGQTVPEPHIYDMSDAFVIALSGPIVVP